MILKSIAYNSKVILTVLLIVSINCLGQQPGGVIGTKVWYVTSQSKLSANFLRDTSGNKYDPFNTKARPDSNLNINFHAATFFHNSATVQIKNFDPNEITFIGIVYPTSKLAVNNPIISLTNGKQSFELLHNRVDTNKKKLLDFGNASKYRNTFLIQSPNTTNANAMKTCVMGGPWNKLRSSIWGNKSDAIISSNFTGYIPELILYGRKLSNKEIRQIQSYLCIKYGITLDTSYFNSKGEMIWDINSSILNKYHNRVCAIGRDAASNLWQPKSNTTYEDNGYVAYNYDADNGCSSPKDVEKFIPETDQPSLYRSLTIEFQEDLRKVPENQFLFWGDNNLEIDSVDIKLSRLKYKKEDYPYLKIISGRKWMIYNKDNVVNQTKLVIAGANYEKFSNSLFNKLYQPYDYQRYRYLLLQIVEDSIVSAKLNSYFGRECFDSVNERFSTRTIVWDSVGWKNNEEPYHIFTLGRIPVLNIFKIDLASTLSKKTKTLDYPYLKSRPINNSVVYDTLLPPFKVKANDKLAFIIPDGLNVKKEGLILKILEQGQWKILPQKSVYKEGDTTAFILDEGIQGIKVIDDKNKGQGIESEKSNTTNVHATKNKDYSEIERRPPLIPTGTVKYFISADKLNETNTFLLEIRDVLGQVTILPFKTENLKTIKTK